MRRSASDHIILLALARTVRELRARLYITQEGLAFRARVHRNRIGAIELGEANVTFTKLIPLLDALDISFDEFALIWARHYTNLGGRVIGWNGLDC